MWLYGSRYTYDASGCDALFISACKKCPVVGGFLQLSLIDERFNGLATNELNRMTRSPSLSTKILKVAWRKGVERLMIVHRRLRLTWNSGPSMDAVVDMRLSIFKHAWICLINTKEVVNFKIAVSISSPLWFYLFYNWYKKVCWFFSVRY